MRAQTTTRISRRRRSSRTGRALALGLGICALAIPETAVAQANDGDYSSVNSITGGSSGSSQAPHGANYSSVNAITPPASPATSGLAERTPTELAQRVGSHGGSAGSHGGDPAYASVNSITGASASEPSSVTGSPSSTDDGFDWVSAAIGAGSALALTALGGVALLTSRRRPPVAPSA
jgi:hypothetical protein